jgi:hypothetical protein
MSVSRWGLTSRMVTLSSNIVERTAVVDAVANRVPRTRTGLVGAL